MGDVAEIKNAYNWNLSRLGKAFGVHRDTVRRYLQDVGVEPVARERNAPLYSMADIWSGLIARNGLSDGPIDPSQLPPQERRAWYQSENERLKFEKDQRHLVPDDEVAREMAVMVKAIANGLDSLPDELERECGLSADALDHVQTKIDAIRELIYEEATE